MKRLVIGKGLWDIIEDGYVDPDWATLSQADRPTKREAQKKNSFTIYHIQSTLYKRLFPRIASCNTKKDA